MTAAFERRVVVTVLLETGRSLRRSGVVTVGIVVSWVDHRTEEPSGTRGSPTSRVRESDGTFRRDLPVFVVWSTAPP